MTLPTPRRLLTLFFLLSALTASAQTLARPGWAGSGISSDLWWKHAILYQLDPATFNPAPGESPLHTLLPRLDYIRSLGADAILLTPIQPDPAHPTAINPALGSLDDLDDLIREASRRSLRILLDLDPQLPAADAANVARFWLNRGIAGFHVSGTTDAAHAQASQLRTVTNSYLGQRILIGDADPTLPAAPTPRTYPPAHLTPQLLLDTGIARQDKLSAATLRPLLGAAQDIFDTGHVLPLLASDSPTTPRSFTRFGDGHQNVAIARIVATILLTTRAGALLYNGQELGVPTPEPTPPITWVAPSPVKLNPGTVKPSTPLDASSATPNAALEDADPASLLNWYRKLAALHHGNATIASGSSTLLNQDDKNVLVWIRKPQAITPFSPPIVILCNLSAQPVTLSLKADLARLHLRGSFLRTLLRSDTGMGTLHLDSLTLAPYSAYLGQLRY